jgi:hypothetical protein
VTFFNFFIQKITNFTLAAANLVEDSGIAGFSLHFNPNPVEKEKGTNWTLFTKAFKVFNPLFPQTDKNIEGSEEYTQAVKNVQTMIGIILTGPAAAGNNGVIGISAKLSLTGGLDDLSGNFDSGGNTLIQKGLGEKAGTATKIVLNAAGVYGASKSIIKDGVNASDVISGSIDVKGVIENTNQVIKSE